jgi:hypothetical protein
MAIQSEIVPSVLESAGLIQETSLEFLQKVADLANQTQKIGNDSMMKYFVKCVSFAFQNAVGTAINLRSRDLWVITKLRRIGVSSLHKYWRKVLGRVRVNFFVM